MSTNEVISLLAIGMILQILGTASVAYNYFRGAELARQMHDKVTAVQLASRHELASPAYQFKHLDSAYFANITAKKVEEQTSTLIDEAIGHLRTRWYLTVGIILYFISAILEFAAGVGALNGR